MTEIFRGKTHCLVVDIVDEKLEGGEFVACPPKGIKVGLPHSCDQWDLAGSFHEHLDGTDSCATMTPEEAVSKLEAMRDECEAAIAAIQMAPVWGHSP